jgi:hypothetical protein
MVATCVYRIYMIPMFLYVVLQNRENEADRKEHKDSLKLV